METASAVMNTATNQLIFELSSLIISLVIGVIGIYVRNFLKTNEYAKKYNLYNEKTERVLSNAVMYAEAKAKTIVGSELSKRNLAFSYIEKISPDIIAKEGNKLELMLDRKVEQMFQKEVQANRGIVNNKDIAPAVVSTTGYTILEGLIYDTSGNCIGVAGNVGPSGDTGVTINNDELN